MKRSAMISAMCLLTAACGGGGGGDSQSAAPPPPVTNASPGGIWEGTLGSGQEVIGLVTESGEFHFLTNEVASITQYFGTITMSGSNATGQFTGYTEAGFDFGDGSTRGTGGVNGTVQERASLIATTTFRTSAGTTESNTVDLTYHSLYERDSSLATIAGNFEDLRTGSILSVSSSGVAFLQDAATGCIINGNVSVIDGRFNVYRVQYTYSSCRGADAVLNGSTFRGLATLDNTGSPEALIVGAQSLVGSTGISVVHLLERT